MTHPRRLLLAAALAVVPGAGASAWAAASPSPAPPRGVTAARAAATSAAILPQYTGRVLVSLRSPRSGLARSAAGALAASGARLAGPQAPQIGMVTAIPPPGVAPGRLAARLRRRSDVRAATLERRFLPREVPNDPALSQAEGAPGTPAGTPVQWWAAREGLPHAWDVTHGSGALVAVIDSGIDATHPEFAGRIARTNDLDATAGDGPADTDQFGHGTHVSGLACAAAGNGVGLAGAGYGCDLIVEKSDFTEGSVIQAITDATDHGALAINMSFGTSGSQPAPPALYDAVAYAYSHNVVLVAAAADSPTTEQGDPGNVLQPAGSGPDVSQGRGLDVTSANFGDARSSFAGSGSEVSLAAYGSFYDDGRGGPSGLLSTFPANHASLEDPSVDLTDPGAPLMPPCNCRTTFDGDNRYAYLAGTSMAAPQVTSAAAMIRQLNPDLSAGDVIRVLKQTARRPAGGGWSADLGWGILDVGAAVDAARVIDRRAPVSRLSAPARTRGRAVTLRWSGSDPAPAGLVPSGIAQWVILRQVGAGPLQTVAVLPAHQTSLRVHVRGRHVYSWYVIAVDAAGNREVKRRPDARTRVLAPRRASSRRGRARGAAVSA